MVEGVKPPRDSLIERMEGREMRGVGLEVYGVKWGGESSSFWWVIHTVRVMCLNLPVVGTGMRSLDREVSVSGCWVF